jgi:predicted nucleic acid-binding protein
MKSMHLDTNVLILTFGESSKIRKELEIQLSKGYQLYISAFVWHEFVSGPIAEIQKQYACP